MNTDSTDLLHEAAESENISDVIRAVKNGADINSLNQRGNTVLTTSLNYGRGNEFIERLLLLGASPNLKNACGQSPLVLVTKEPDTTILNTLLKYGAKLLVDDPLPGDTLLHSCAEGCKSEALKSLLTIATKTDLDRFDNFSRTPLICAIASKCYECAKILLDAGVDVDAHKEETAGNTALICAIEESDEKMISLLLERGANPNIRGWMRANAIDIARSHEEFPPHLFSLLKARSAHFPEEPVMVTPQT